jgi:hypothetical protein
MCSGITLEYHFQRTILFKDSDLAQRAKPLAMALLGGVAVGRGFEPLELFSAKIINPLMVSEQVFPDDHCPYQVNWQWLIPRTPCRT